MNGSDDHPSEATMQAWADLHAAADAFDKMSGKTEELVRAIDALISAKVADALREYSLRVEDATGVRP